MISAAFIVQVATVSSPGKERMPVTCCVHETCWVVVLCAVMQGIAAGAVEGAAALELELWRELRWSCGG